MTACRLAVALATGMLAAVHDTHAQAYPSQPLRVIVPFARGDGADSVARLVMERAGAVLGTAITFDNRPGGSGLSGVQSAARAKPDGHTVLVGDRAQALGASAPAGSTGGGPAALRPVANVAALSAMLVARPSGPSEPMRRFAAQARPKTVVVASSGMGPLLQRADALLHQITGSDVALIPYRSTGTALGDLLAGHVDMALGPVPSFMPLVREGRLEALGVASAVQLPALPNVPAMARSLPGFELSLQLALFVPAGTPAAVVEKLNAAVLRALSDPQLRSRLGAEGATVEGQEPAPSSSLDRKAQLDPCRQPQRWLAARQAAVGGQEHGHQGVAPTLLQRLSGCLS
jgi:tripartite-type tricarboxylate transporter receptor subunit TctC